jgi:Zn-dependent peptidase ImmA (M78 family)
MTQRPNYEALKHLASQKRAEHGVTTDKLGLKVVRDIYRAEGIRIDSWDLSPRIRAVYMCDDGDPSVAISKNLPAEPKLFSLVHELKHHYVDQRLIADGKIRCGDYNANQVIEIGAQVFAAEFIYPEHEFLECIDRLGIVVGECTKEDVVRLKRACGAQVSYTFLRKRLERLGFATLSTLAGVQFQKLEEELFGIPIYKQPWFKARRARRNKA